MHCSSYLWFLLPPTNEVWGKVIFTVRKWSWGKVMFLHLSVTLLTGRRRCTPPPRQTPSWVDTPWADTPGDTPFGQTSPWADTHPQLGRHPIPLGPIFLPGRSLSRGTSLTETPQDRDPPGQKLRPPWTETPVPPHPRHRPPWTETLHHSCTVKSGQYASYWNTFLLISFLQKLPYSLLPPLPRGSACVEQVMQQNFWLLGT